MVVYCRSDHCNKTFSTIFNRNKHEKKKGHGPKDQKREIPYDAEQNLFLCPSAQCETSAKYKYNIVKHLKSCNKINKKYCDKTFTRKSSCDRHMRQCRPDEYPAESGEIDDNLPPAEECYDFPTMVDVAGPSRYEKTEKITDDSSSNDANVVFDRAPIPMEEDPPSSSPPNNHPIASSETKEPKHSRLEKAILAIKKQQLEYPIQRKCCYSTETKTSCK